MKLCAMALTLFAFLGSVAFAKPRDPADYPLQVHILDTQWNRTPWGTSGGGHGNLKEGASSHGFEYTFTCPGPFNATQGNQYYPAKWSKNQSRLKLLVSEIGNAKNKSDCELKVSLSDFVYVMHDGHLGTLTQTQLQTLVRSAKPDDVDLTHYPLRFVLLQGEWIPANPGFNGSGRGNLFYQDGNIKGIEYSGLCAGRLRDSVGSESYPARYDEISRKLTVLAHKTGETTFSSACEFNVNVRAVVFLRNANGELSTVSQEEARTRRETFNSVSSRK